MSKAIKLSTQVVGNAGMYHTCYKLSLLGWNAMPTARNAKGVDIIAYNSDASTMLSFQIKTLSKRNPVMLGASLEKLMGDYWIIVTNAVGEPKSYILRPKEIRTLANEGTMSGKPAFWLRPEKYDRKEFLEGWHRIGHGDGDAKP